MGFPRTIPVPSGIERDGTEVVVAELGAHRTWYGRIGIRIRPQRLQKLGPDALDDGVDRVIDRSHRDRLAPACGPRNRVRAIPLDDDDIIRLGCVHDNAEMGAGTGAGVGLFALVRAVWRAQVRVERIDFAAYATAPSADLRAQVRAVARAQDRVITVDKAAFTALPHTVVFKAACAGCSCAVYALVSAAWRAQVRVCRVGNAAFAAYAFFAFFGGEINIRRCRV